LGYTSVSGYASADGICGIPDILGYNYVDVDGRILLSSPLGAALALGAGAGGRVLLASPLGAALALGAHDFTGQLGGTTTYYVCDISGAAQLLRVPISSWQATLQLDRQQYLQVVIPAVTDYVGEISARQATGEFIVSRGARTADGDTLIEYEMARAPLQTVRYDRGPERYTCTMSGYSAAAAAIPGLGTVALQSVRMISITDAIRVRCAIDWLLTPGQTVTADGRSFTADYISYYCEATDSYMDVGERAA
jgi:hypothetical protein